MPGTSCSRRGVGLKLVTVVLGACLGLLEAQIIEEVSTLAGNGARGNLNAKGSSASFNSPAGVVVCADCADGAPAAIVTDHNNQLIRRINFANTEVTTLSGTGGCCIGDGAANEASFSAPFGLGMSPEGGKVFVADFDSSHIRSVSTTTGEVTTAWDNSVAAMEGGDTLRAPSGVAVGEEEMLVIADSGNNRIAVVQSGQLTRLAGSGSKGYGDGDATTARFSEPTAVALSLDGTRVFVSDKGNHAIRAVNMQTGAVTTLVNSAAEAGCVDGEGLKVARLREPESIAVDPNPSRNRLVIADWGNHVIRALSLSPPYTVSTIAGTCGAGQGYVDGAPALAKFFQPSSVAFNPSGSALVIAEWGNNRLRALAKCDNSPCTSLGHFRGPCAAPEFGDCVACSKHPNGRYISAAAPFNEDSCGWVCEDGFYKVSNMTLACLPCTNVIPGNATYSAPGQDDQPASCPWECLAGFQVASSTVACVPVPPSSCLWSQYTPSAGLCSNWEWRVQTCWPNQTSLDVAFQAVGAALESIVNDNSLCEQWLSTGSSNIVPRLATAVQGKIASLSATSTAPISDAGLCSYFGGKPPSPPSCAFLCDLAPLVAERLLGTCFQTEDCPAGRNSTRLPCCYSLTQMVKRDCDSTRASQVSATRLSPVPGLCNIAHGCIEISSAPPSSAGSTVLLLLASTLSLLMCLRG